MRDRGPVRHNCTRGLLAIVLLLVVGAAGCASGPDFPTGQWMASPPDGSVFIIDFRDDGSFVATGGASVLELRQVDAGTFDTDGDTLRFLTDSRCRVYGGHEAGSYTWTLAGQQLALTAQEDLCQQRHALLDGAVLARPPAAVENGAAADPVAAPVPWWNEETFYEVFVRSFSDSDGDGNGDLRGLIHKLDYLNDGDAGTTTDLGVTALWLMPIVQSPSYHGYDTTDYYSIESDYGTKEDFAELLDAAHARGMKVIVDLVLNHTSSEHPWFADAASSPTSAKRDWYVWSDTDPGQVTPWGTRAWHSSSSGYYLGLFWEGMPDLNYRNPEVTQQMYDVGRFWLQDMGADGFRLDAVRHLIEEEGSVDGTPATHQWLASWDDYLDSLDPQALTVGEVWDDTPAVAPYVAGDEVDLAFEFSLAQGIVQGVEFGDASRFETALSRVAEAYPAGQFAPFLTNHDQDRVMSQLGGDVAKAKLAAAALLTLPGVPFVYYGEEIGMVGRKPDEQIRTPMQWDGSVNAGFTTGAPWVAVNGDYASVNVDSQAGDPDSLLSHYRALIAARSGHPALRTGGIAMATSTCDNVAAHVRASADGTDNALVVLNFAAAEQAGCALSAAGTGVPAGTYEASDALTGQQAARVEVSDDGTIEGYVPLSALGARQSLVLVLVPAG